jgi:site-specific recombinase XerD
VPLPKDLHKRLRAFIDKTRGDRDSDRVFLSARKPYEPLTENGVAQVVTTLAKNARITKRANPHAYRHAFSTHWLREGGDPITLMKILGHSSLAMITAHYSHLIATDTHVAMERIFGKG